MERAAGAGKAVGRAYDITRNELGGIMGKVTHPAVYAIWNRIEPDDNVIVIGWKGAKEFIASHSGYKIKAFYQHDDAVEHLRKKVEEHERALQEQLDASQSGEGSGDSGGNRADAPLPDCTHRRKDGDEADC